MSIQRGLPVKPAVSSAPPISSVVVDAAPPDPIVADQRIERESSLASAVVDPTAAREYAQTAKPEPTSVESRLDPGVSVFMGPFFARRDDANTITIGVRSNSESNAVPADEADWFVSEVESGQDTLTLLVVRKTRPLTPASPDVSPDQPGSTPLVVDQAPISMEPTIDDVAPEAVKDAS